MKWFRTRIRLGTRLALAAFAVQFVLSFGHVHAEVTQPQPPVSAAAQNQRTKAVATPATADAVRPGSKSPQHGHAGTDYCAICAVMALANNVLFATPPVLRLPEAYHFLYLTTDAEFNHLDTHRVAFQPRAPPAS